MTAFVQQLGGSESVNATPAEGQALERAFQLDDHRGSGIMRVQIPIGRLNEARQQFADPVQGRAIEPVLGR